MNVLKQLLSSLTTTEKFYCNLVVGRLTVREEDLSGSNLPHLNLWYEWHFEGSYKDSFGGGAGGIIVKYS